MIIKLTVKDNDYSNLMRGFVQNLGSRVSQLPSNIRELDGLRQFEIIKEINKIDKLLNPNITEKHTDEDKAFLKEKITEAFVIYVCVREDENTADYLTRNFKVDIVDSMEDKWENGEAWYWFQHSRTVLNQ